MKSSQLQIRISATQKESIRRQAQAAGLDMSEWILGRIFPTCRAEFERLLQELVPIQETSDRHYVLAAINDFLSRLTKKELNDVASTELEAISLTLLMQNYVAAMIETACYRMKTVVSKELSKIEGLRKPFFATDILSLRLYLLTNSPLAFRKRNIFIDSTIGDRV